MTKNPLVSIIMGSNSDWPVMSHTKTILDEFNIENEALIISAHRTPERLYEFAKNARSRGIKVIIAGAGGAAHLPGMASSLTSIPVLGVPIQSGTLFGIDSLLSIVQMPYGIPVPTMAIGKAGAQNAALSAISILSLNDETIAKQLEDFRKKQTESVSYNPE